jgi:hypothetical protein
MKSNELRPAMILIATRTSNCASMKKLDFVVVDEEIAVECLAFRHRHHGLDCPEGAAVAREEQA